MSLALLDVWTFEKFIHHCPPTFLKLSVCPPSHFFCMQHLGGVVCVCEWREGGGVVWKGDIRCVLCVCSQFVLNM